MRWRVRAKLDEVKVQQERIAAMRILLERAAKCRCLDVVECGRVLLKAKKAGPIARERQTFYVAAAPGGCNL